MISVSLVFRLLFFEPEQKENVRLLWSDEFTVDGAPDSTNWTYDIGTGHNGWGNNEIQYYTNTRENSYVRNGKLFIEAIKKDGQWTSARLKSQGKRNWTYGKIVFSAKLPVGRGTWPALWMLGENITLVGWPKCGEIDVMEHVGRNPSVVQSVVHTLASHGDTMNKNSTTVPSFDSEFHTYEVLWTKDKMEFFIDGRSYYTYKPATMEQASWPFDKPFFILMNIAIGGNLGGEVDPTLDLARMEIDYVRVYAVENL